MGLLRVPQTYHNRPGITLEDVRFRCADDLRTCRPSATFELPVVSGSGKSRVMVAHGVDRVLGEALVFNVVFGNGCLKGVDSRLVPLQGFFDFSDSSNLVYLIYYGP